jgi:hypothetical protein
MDANLRLAEFVERHNILPSDANLRLALLKQTIFYRLFIFYYETFSLSVFYALFIFQNISLFSLLFKKTLLLPKIPVNGKDLF